MIILHRLKFITKCRLTTSPQKSFVAALRYFRSPLFARERVDLVGMPQIKPILSALEGTINDQEVNIDTVKYAEYIINYTRNASQNGQPDYQYLHSIGINRYDAQRTLLSVGAPAYMFSTDRHKYEGGFIISVPNSPYKTDFVNINEYLHLYRYGTIDLEWFPPTSTFNLKPNYMEFITPEIMSRANERGRSIITQETIYPISHQHSLRVSDDDHYSKQETYPNSNYVPLPYQLYSQTEDEFLQSELSSKEYSKIMNRYEPDYSVMHSTNTQMKEVKTTPAQPTSEPKNSSTTLLYSPINGCNNITLILMKQSTKSTQYWMKSMFIRPSQIF